MAHLEIVGKQNGEGPRRRRIVEMSAEEEAAFEAARAPVLEKERAAALRYIDAVAEEARQRYITDGSGQAMVYMEKERQARQYRDDGYPADMVPALVAAEADALSATAKEAADSILTTRAAWESAAASIERARRGGKVAVRGAVDCEAVWAARDTALADLEAV